MAKPKKDSGGYPIGRKPKGHKDGWHPERDGESNQFVDPKKLPPRGSKPKSNGW